MEPPEKNSFKSFEYRKAPMNFILILGNLK